eukprot:979618-Pyramimonas_sp.AAC.1
MRGSGWRRCLELALCAASAFSWSHVFGTRDGWKGRSPAIGSLLPAGQNKSSRARNGVWEKGVGKRAR